MSALAAAYRPRRPTETVLYAVVRDWLETFLAHARDTYEAPIPRYVEQELRGYLRCGVFAHGFVRAHCDACGQDLLVAFSCKGRAVCPSCAGRRMANVAAHLVDRVLPAVPVRQWVLSLPFELRRPAASRADVLSALSRIFHDAVFARYAAWAKGHGLGNAPTGAVCHVQRFGSSINLHIHFHSMFLDGVFTRDDMGRPVFHPAPPPERRELEEVLRRLHRRAIAWLRRRGLVDACTAEEAPSDQASLDACISAAMQRGTFRTMREGADDDDPVYDPMQPPPSEAGAVELDGFNLHAGVAIAGDDDLSRERLMRYGARPALALERLRRLPDGRLAYRIKKLRAGRAKHRVMTPLELLARLAAIVPPPRFPLVRYAGVLAPRSSWRRDVAPRPRESTMCDRLVAAGAEVTARAERVPARSTPRGRESNSSTRERSAGSGQTHRKSVSREEGASSGAQRAAAPVVIHPAPLSDHIVLSPNVLAVKHWNRLLGGALYAATARVDWAGLLRRSFDVDVLACAQCGGRLHVIGEVTDAAAVRLVLESLGLPTDAPRAARARDPTDLLADQTEH